MHPSLSHGSPNGDTPDAYRVGDGSVSSNARAIESGGPSAAITSAVEAARPVRKSKYQRGWRKIVRNFTPSWFAVTMGTGITSILLHNLPYNAHWLQYISYAIFALNVLLFVLFTLISLLRYVLWPNIWTAMIRHPSQRLFLGCFPMGLATIVNMVCFVCVPQWQGDWWRLAWALWWIDVGLAIATCCYLPFAM